MIYTGSHNACNTNEYKTYAILGNCGKDASYEGDCYPALAPKLSFWTIWRNNIGEKDELENNRFYIEEFYKQVLSQLDAQKVYEEVDGSILLCYEPNTDFCHRHIVAAWFEILLGKNVPEVILNGTKPVEVKKSSYIKKYLQEIMEKSLKLKELNWVLLILHFINSFNTKNTKSIS